jgi:eukaryotic-like serine/threonine-protein kinase
MQIPQVGETLGHFLILERIGAGGMGVVYRARDKRLDRDVALKVLPSAGFADEQARKRLRREALTVSKLNHPNIATLFDFDNQDDLDFLVMEYVVGVTLADKLARGALPEKDVLILGGQIANALEDAHEHGIIHCDLKPGNIMLTTTQQVKLLDFGLAKLLRVSTTATTESLPELNKVAGTLPYMSPEQLRGQPADPRTDIYSSGIVLFEMATGRRPFEKKLSTALIEEILHRDPPRPTQFNSSLSPKLQDIILKCVEKECADRYQSAKELGGDLRRLASPESLTVGPLIRPRVPPIRSIQIFLGLIALLSALGFFVWHARSSMPRKPQVVLIGDFHNRTGESVLNDTIPELLAIGMEESGYVSVFPSSRASEVLRLMNRAPNASIDEATGREICQRQALEAVILGSITKLGDRYVLVVRAVSPEGANLASTENVVRNIGELPAALDRISAYLRKALGEPRRQIEESSLPLAEVTSSSLEAIRNFTAGKQNLYAGSLNEAGAYFRKALQLDPSFAMAREYLGIVYIHQGNPVRAQQELKRTLLLADHVTEPERQKILGDYSLLLRDFDQAIVHYKRLKDLRPRDSAPSLNLAQCFLGKLNFDSALEETTAAVELEPAPGPENNLAEIYLLRGDYRSALSTSESVLHKDPSNVRALENQGWAYLLTDQPIKARAVFAHMVEFGGDAESRARSALADMALSQGIYSEAKRQLEVGMAVDRQMENPFAAGKKQIALLTAAWQFTGNKPVGDLQLGEAASDPQLAFLAGLLYARADLLGEFTAIAHQLEGLGGKTNVPSLASFREMLAARIALTHGDRTAAVESAQRAVEFEPSTLAVQVLAEAFEASHRPREAIDAYERVLSRSGERSQSYDSPAYHTLVEIHYHVGALYDDLGETSAARSHLEEFLHWWSHPESKSGIYRNARDRLRRLEKTDPRAGIPTPAM